MMARGDCQDQNYEEENEEDEEQNLGDLRRPSQRRCNHMSEINKQSVPTSTKS